MAKVLTHEALQSLATLDAGDSVECYAVSRLSKIEAFEDLTPTEPSKSPPRFIQSEDSEEGTIGYDSYECCVFNVFQHSHGCFLFQYETKF